MGALKPQQFNPIPTGCCQVTLIYGLILPMADRNRVNLKIMVESNAVLRNLKFWGSLRTYQLSNLHSQYGSLLVELGWICCAD